MIRSWKKAKLKKQLIKANIMIIRPVIRLIIYKAETKQQVYMNKTLKSLLIFIGILILASLIQHY